MALAEHTTKAFDADLRELMRMTAEMGGAAERQLVEAGESLLTRNRDRGRLVISGDAVLDRLQREIERKAIATIAVRQPVAIDLRDVVGILRIANNLERIGDLAKNIGKRVLVLDGAPMPHVALRGMRHITDLALDQLRHALDTFAERDGRKAIAVCRRDKEIDSLYVSLFRELLTYMMEDPGTITDGIHLLFCAKNIERIGDHTTNIAEAVYYMIEGEVLAMDGSKVDPATTPQLALDAISA